MLDLGTIRNLSDAARPRWRRQGTLSRPATVEPKSDGRRPYAGFAAPLGQSLRATIEGDTAVVPLVVALFFGCGPPAVAGCVPHPSLNAVDGVQRTRLRPHVREEGIETVKPPIADGYTGPAIAVVVRGVRVATPLFDRRPCPILGLGTHAVNGFSRRVVGRLEAPATKRSVLSEISPQHGSLSAAVASTEPSPTADVSDHSPVAVPLFRDVFDVMVEFAKNADSHDASESGVTGQSRNGVASAVCGSLHFTGARGGQ